LTRRAMEGCPTSVRWPGNHFRQTMPQDQELPWCTRKLEDPPLVLGRATPDSGILTPLQCPSQTRPAHWARPADLPGFLDLKQGRPRRADGEEQVGIRMLAGGAVAPVGAGRTWLTPEKALVCVAHRGHATFLLRARWRWLLVPNLGATRLFRACGRLPSWPAGHLGSRLAEVAGSC
jgi:hypothetical protein